MSIELRPARDDHAEALARLHHDTRDDLLGAGLPDDVLPFVFELQHRAQEEGYDRAHPGLERFVVLDEGVVVGRLYLAEHDDRVVLVDVAVAPEHRDRGIGGEVLDWVVERAGERQVQLHVRHDSRAGHLYARAGFVEVGRTATHAAMVRDPQANEAT